MCIMCVIRSDQVVSDDLIAGMYNKGNRDGAGVMFVENGTLFVDKALTKTENSVRDFYKQYQGRDMAFHVRNQTLGVVDLDNCHPYWVTRKEWGHVEDIAMMHNGTIKDIQVNYKWSDSRNLAEHFLRDLLGEHPELLTYEPFTRFLSAMIGRSKLIFLTGQNQFIVINSGLGKIHLPTGIWVSTQETISPLPPLKSYKSAGESNSHQHYQGNMGFRPPNPPNPEGSTNSALPQPATQPTGALTSPELQGCWVEGNDGIKRFSHSNGHKEGVILTLASSQGEADSETVDLIQQSGIGDLVVECPGETCDLLEASLNAASL